MNLNNKKILAFFAHPDDETLGAGATFSKLSSSGSEIHVAIPATGIYARKNTKDESGFSDELSELRRNCAEAQAILGIDPSRIYFGEFPDNEIDKHTLLELVHWLEDIIVKVKPDVIFTHHRFCTNIDHRYCHEAAIVATRPSVNSHIAVVSAEIPSSTGYLRPTFWEPNLYIEVGEKNIENKIKAMGSYKNEAKPDPHPRSPEVLKALAKVRGSEAGFMFAEAFMIQKTFNF